MALVEKLLDTGGPLPNRLHLVEPMVTFLDDFYRLLNHWCEQTISEIGEWPDTRGVGLTARGRERLKQVLARPKP